MKISPIIKILFSKVFGGLFIENIQNFQLFILWSESVLKFEAITSNIFRALAAIELRDQYKDNYAFDILFKHGILNLRQCMQHFEF